MIYVGIDTGEHTGVAVWHSDEKRFISIATRPLWAALQDVLALKATYGGVTVIFEDARQRKWLPRERSASEYRGKLMGAGAVKRDAKIWEEFLKDNEIPYMAIPPRVGLTQWSADNWARVTQWQGRTSEHARDAALLVYGRQ